MWTLIVEVLRELRASRAANRRTSSGYKNLIELLVLGIFIALLLGPCAGAGQAAMQ